MADHFDTAGSFWSNWMSHSAVCQVTLSDRLSLLHGFDVQLLVVVYFGNVLWLGLSFIVKEGCIVIRYTLIIFYVAEDVEQILIIALREFQLLRQIVLQVTIGTTLPRFVSLIFLRSHRQHILDALLCHCAFDIVNI